MKDLLTYVENIDALRAELVIKFEDKEWEFNKFLIQEEETGYINATLLAQTPIQYKGGNNSVALCRVNAEQEAFLMALGSLEVIGSHTKGAQNYTFLAGGQVKMESVYSTAPYITQDPDGVDVEITPPVMFGVFA